MKAFFTATNSFSPPCGPRLTRQSDAPTAQHGSARLGFPQSSAAKCNLDGVTEKEHTPPRGVLAAGWRIADWPRLEAKIAAASIPTAVAVFIQHNRKKSRTRLLGKRCTTKSAPHTIGITNVYVALITQCEQSVSVH